MTLPPDVVALLGGTTRDEGWEVILPLLTVDADGFPRVCLLSRNEVDVDGPLVRCVLRGRRTTTNLRRDRRALLVVVHEVTAYYLRLALRRDVPDEEGLGGLAVEFDLDEVEQDSRHTPLRPMQFMASSWVRVQDQTDEARALLDRLAAADVAAPGSVDGPSGPETSG